MGLTRHMYTCTHVCRHDTDALFVEMFDDQQPGKKSLVLMFRGTQEFADVLTDLKGLVCVTHVMLTNSMSLLELTNTIVCLYLI